MLWVWLSQSETQCRSSLGRLSPRFSRIWTTTPSCKCLLNLPIMPKSDIANISRSVRVSKRWAQVLNQDTVLWDELLLGHPGNPGQAHFVEFLKKHRNIKTFGVTEVRDFVLATSKVRAILALPRVQRLRFSTSRPPLPQSYAYGMLKDLPKNKLTHIRVFGMSLVLVKELIAWNRESLQVLDITDQILPDWHNFCNLGYFGQLRKLRLIGSKTSRGGVSMVSHRPSELIGS